MALEELKSERGNPAGPSRHGRSQPCWVMQWPVSLARLLADGRVVTDSIGYEMCLGLPRESLLHHLVQSSGMWGGLLGVTFDINSECARSKNAPP